MFAQGTQIVSKTGTVHVVERTYQGQTATVVVGKCNKMVRGATQTQNQEVTCKNCKKGA